MIPADLLQKLQEADSELWEDIYQAGFNHCSWPDYLIQGKLQEAIRARGWAYRLAYIPEESICSVVIMEKKTSFWLPIGNLKAGAKGITEAEALLLAYLSALGSPDFKF